MANYDSLTNAIKAAVKTNGTGAITGATLQATLLGTIEDLTVGFQFMGVATPATSPDSNDKKEFYLAGPGTYANFGSSVTVPKGKLCIFKKDNGSWSYSYIVCESDLMAIEVDLTQTGRVYYTDGTSDANSKFDYSDFIECNEGDEFVISGYGTASTGMALAYNSNKTFQSCLLGGVAGQYVKEKIIIPAGIKYVRFCRANSTHQSYLQGFVGYISKYAQIKQTASLLETRTIIGLCRPQTVKIVTVSGKQRLQIANNSIYFPELGGSNYGAVDIDIEASKTEGAPTNFIQVLVNSDRSITANSFGEGLQNGQRLMMVILMTTKWVWSTVAYSIEGDAFGIDPATASKSGLLSKEDKAILDSLFYNYPANEPIIPNDLFLLDDAPTPIFKRSMVFNPLVGDANFTLSSVVNGRCKIFDIAEPLNLNHDDVGNTAKITLEQKTNKERVVYKSIAIHKATVSSLNGKTPKVLMIGDSITHGNNGANSSPIVKANELLPSRYGITPEMIGTFAPYGVLGEGRGTFSLEAMSGVNSSLGDFSFPSYGGTLESSPTKTTPTKNYNPFTFPATNEDFVSHPDWCFTNKWNNPSEPDNLSYADATDEQRANCHFYIFDFNRYIHIWGDENHKPDIITIALGTNDWWMLNEIDLAKTLLSVNIIYAQIRAALPTAKILFVPSQAISVLYQNHSQGNWETEIVPLLLGIQTKLTIWKNNGDNNVFELPLYACGSRWLSYKQSSQIYYLNSNNTAQWSPLENDVHILDDIGSAGYWQYMDAIITAIACLS